MAQFRYIGGSTEALRAALAHILAHLPEFITAEAPYPASLAQAIGVEVCDICSLNVKLGSGRTAVVQLLNVPLGQLVVNHIMPTQFEELTDEDSSDTMTKLFVDCLYPAFEATPGTTLVVQRDGEEVELSHK